LRPFAFYVAFAFPHPVGELVENGELLPQRLGFLFGLAAKLGHTRISALVPPEG